MGAAFVVTLREAFEAALILGIVYTYLDKIGGRAYYRYATAGGALGLLASIGAGVAVSFLSGPLLDLGPDVVRTVVVFAAVVLLTGTAGGCASTPGRSKGTCSDRSSRPPRRRGSGSSA